MQTEPRTIDPGLGRPRPGQQGPRYHHAIIIGGGIAGLATAAALARHVERVTIVERDDLPDGPARRPGVPQSRHLHVLLPGGSHAMELLVPGFERELEAAGATSIDMPSEMLWLSAAGWMPQFRTRRRLLSATRDLIESVIRRSVLANPAITLLDGHETCSLVADEHGEGVVGAEVRPRGRQVSVALSADLVVDASGRRSRAAEWLTALGYPEPPLTTVDSGLGYATRLYERPADAAPRAVIMQGRAPDQGRTAVLFPVEGGRWMLTIGGVGGDHPPTDEAGFAIFTKGLRDPLIHEFVTRADPVSPIWGWSLTESRRRHFEGLEHWPAGFVVVGDAACAFNPVYGQGMSVATKTAVKLGERVAAQRRTGQPLAYAAAQLQRDVALGNAGAWMVSTGEDLKYETTTGGRPTGTDRLLGRYFARVVRAASVDPTVHAAFVDVLGMVADPSTLLRPTVAAHVIVPRRVEALARPDGALVDLLGERALDQIDTGGRHTARSSVGAGGTPPAPAAEPEPVFEPGETPTRAASHTRAGGTPLSSPAPAWAGEPGWVPPLDDPTSLQQRAQARAAHPSASASQTASGVAHSTLVRLLAVQRQAAPSVGGQGSIDDG